MDHALEQGRRLAFSAIPAERTRGIHLLLEAQNAGEREASFLLVRCLTEGLVQAEDLDGAKRAVRVLGSASLNGDFRAAAALDRLCDARYRLYAASLPAAPRGEKLIASDGRPVELTGKGFFLPVRARLARENGTHVLHLRVKVSFSYPDSIRNQKKFEQAVLSGIRQWRGDYRVFGGQKLRVQVETVRRRGWSAVSVLPVTASLRRDMERITVPLAKGKKKEQIQSVLDQRRSFASGSLRWSLHSKKVICIQCEDEEFRDYREIQAVAKHEFGHALGLGDLYESRSDRLPGIAPGTYPELDCYHTYGKNYHLVMCDHHGRISNNDMEMVLLALRDNVMQLYQPGNLKGDLSAALGKGN